MVKKKLDARVRALLQAGVKNSHRSFIILVGDRGRDQVVNLHYILSKLQVKKRPDVLWCYKKELGFSTHRKKRMKQVRVWRRSHPVHSSDPSLRPSVRACPSVGAVACAAAAGVCRF